MTKKETIAKEVKVAPKKAKTSYKSEIVEIDGESKIKVTYPDGRVEYSIL